VTTLDGKYILECSRSELEVAYHRIGQVLRMRYAEVEAGGMFARYQAFDQEPRRDISWLQPEENAAMPDKLGFHEEELAKGNPNPVIPPQGGQSPESVAPTPPAEAETTDPVEEETAAMPDEPFPEEEPGDAIVEDDGEESVDKPKGKKGKGK
jgi:hypothetical protein